MPRKANEIAMKGLKLKEVTGPATANRNAKLMMPMIKLNNPIISRQSIDTV